MMCVKAIDETLDFALSFNWDFGMFNPGNEAIGLVPLN